MKIIKTEMMSRFAKILNIVLVVAFVSAGASPACSFISGKSGVIEICAADGSLKTIRVSEDFLPRSSSSSENTDQVPLGDLPKKACDFCFTASHIAVDIVSEQAVIIMAARDAQQEKVISSRYIPPFISSYHAQAPPYLIV